MRKFTITVSQEVTITVNDENVIDRCVNNEPDELDGKGWRDVFYNLQDAEEVIEMLAYNYIANGRTVERLDGWADLDSSAVSYREGNVEYDWFSEL